ncbi:sugar phosphate nucleotidyltransferase [Clostridium perfringens]|nr:sugar phosphate nucleotidyltransferase [Clostridium perfringens]
MLCALIMAGGKGTRFWPLSTEEKPKQFLNLIKNETMIQMTVNRIREIIPIERIFICTNKKYLNLVEKQISDIPRSNIILEPESRNTLPCIALSTFIIDKYYRNCNIIVLPSDHLIEKECEFREILLMGQDYINYNINSIITIGIKPNRAETGYGYIKLDEKVTETNKKVLKVNKFIEKPNYSLAKQYLDSDYYLWNSGMFMWNSSFLLDQIKKFSYKTYDALRNIKDIEFDKLDEFLNANYMYTEKTSIDYGLLEKTDNIYVIPSDIGWDDIGTWKSVERYKKKDLNNNILNKNVKVIESKSNITINNKKKIIMIGIKDIMTVETNDAIFLVNKDYMDKLKDYKEIL